MLSFDMQGLWREMTLAFNAKRIGDILAKAGNTGDARASYERAGAYYREALETLDAESREYGHVQRELAAIPAAAPADAGPPPKCRPRTSEGSPALFPIPKLPPATAPRSADFSPRPRSRGPATTD